MVEAVLIIGLIICHRLRLYVVFQSMTSLIFFRAIQGIGAGAIMPVTVLTIMQIYLL